MRTTLTLDDDVAARLVGASRTSGKSFKEVVNATLRRGLLETRSARQAEPFVVKPQSLGRIKAGLTLDKISAVLEEVDGAAHR